VARSHAADSHRVCACHAAQTGKGRTAATLAAVLVWLDEAPSTIEALNTVCDKRESSMEQMTVPTHVRCAARVLLVRRSCSSRVLLVRRSCSSRVLLVRRSCSSRAPLVLPLVLVVRARRARPLCRAVACDACVQRACTTRVCDGWLRRRRYRYLDYFDLVMSGNHPASEPLVLTRVILNGIPQFGTAQSPLRTPSCACAGCVRRA
jgi:hypothetical protein